MADKILKSASKRVGLSGVSTHSFRRTALTMMSSAGIPLRVIQEISGHNDERDVAALSGSVTRAEAIRLCLRLVFDE
jgi:integrase